MYKRPMTSHAPHRLDRCSTTIIVDNDDNSSSSLRVINECLAIGIILIMAHCVRVLCSHDTAFDDAFIITLLSIVIATAFYYGCVRKHVHLQPL